MFKYLFLYSTLGRMTTSRKLLVYPDGSDPVHCHYEDLASVPAAHIYNTNAYTVSRDIHRPSDLPDSSTSSWNPFSPVLKSSCNRYQALEPHLIGQFVYPSPPPTSLQPGLSVPLPNDYCQNPYSLITERPLECQDNFDGTPDFPLIMEHGFRGYREPLSPPPTLPTQTLTLPPADCHLAQLDEMEDCFDFPMTHPDAHLDTSGEPSHHHLPSPPLSPDWTNMKVARVSYPAPAQNSLFIQGIVHPVPPVENNVYLYGQSSASQPWQHVNNDMEHGSTKASDVLPTSFPSSPPPFMLEAEDCLYPVSWSYLTIDPQVTPAELEDLDNTSHTFFPPPGSPLISSPASSDDSDFHDYEDEFMPPPSSPCLRSVSELPMLEDEGDDHLGLSSPFENDRRWSYEPQSLSNESSAGCNSERVPSIRSFPGVETDEDLIPADLASRSWVPEHCIVIPSTPYITPSTLIPSPDSPSYLMNSLQQGDGTRFSSNSLLLVDDHSARSPIISSSCHIGAELDQLDPVLVASDAELKCLLDLRSRALASERQARMVEAQYKNLKAFWMRDVGRDVVSGEGVGADHGSSPAEEREMQRRLHQEEARMQTVLAMQAKRARKREKERVREVSALMKIKLKERGVSFKRTSPGSPSRHVKDEDVDVDGICVTDGFLQDSETGNSVMIDHTHRSGHRTKPNITTMPQLVARMTLRRREARLRPLTRPSSERGSEVLSDPRLTQSPGRSYKNSPLALPSSTDDEQITMTQNDIGPYQANYPPLHWRMDVDCHACPDSVMDDLGVTSDFDLLSLSNA